MAVLVEQMELLEPEQSAGYFVGLRLGSLVREVDRK